MVRLFFTLALAFLASPFVCGQVDSGRLAAKQPFDPAWRMLAEDSRSLQDDPAQVEHLLDLVHPWLLDSTIEKRTQRHVSFWGWFLDKALGMNWKVLDPKKQKFVGTGSRTMEVFDGTAREVDINLFIMPHLVPYVSLVERTYERTLEHNRGDDKQFRMDNPPFPSPEALKVSEGNYYSVECEVTPSEGIRAEMDAKVMPLQLGPNPLMDHPNFGVEYPSFGMMGTLCMDCNHNCRPEIHPIEWLWWLDLQPDDPRALEWMVVLLHDDTRRFDDWSSVPVEGSISLPFYLPATSQSVHIQIEPLVTHGLMPLEITPPEHALQLKPGMREMTLVDGAGRLRLEVSGSVTLETVWWWLEDVARDGVSGDIAGKIRLAVSTTEGFAAKVSVMVEP